jgi:ribulose-bisphosphate carboxylase large chain
VEQSVEMPVEAIADARVTSEVVGEVLRLDEIGENRFEARIGLAAETVGEDAAQLLNMLFGNASLLDDVVLHDVILPPSLLSAFGGPRQGAGELRRRLGAWRRALTCSALKPQGLPVPALADLARRFALGGVDCIKDDHGLAEQATAPFACRVPAIASAVAAANRETGRATRYIPSLSGDLDSQRRQVALARDCGLDMAMVKPMLDGAANMHAIARDNPDFALLAHPALAGAARIAPPLLIGKLFRLFGATAVVFPGHGGRFGYSRETCRELADAARGDWGGLKSAIPVPAGGMMLQRVPELLEFYGHEVMLLIGGNLLAARERLVEETRAFVAAVEGHRHG